MGIQLAKPADAADGVETLFECRETTICTAAVVPATVIGAPRIVLRLGWIVEHSRRSNDTEHKQDKFHQHPSNRGLLTTQR